MEAVFDVLRQFRALCNRGFPPESCLSHTGFCLPEISQDISIVRDDTSLCFPVGNASPGAIPIILSDNDARLR